MELLERNVGRFELPLRGGAKWRGTIHLTAAQGGRRVLVYAQDGQEMFDSRDCDELATAFYKMGQWLEHIHVLVFTDGCPCAHCQAKRQEAAAREQFCEHCPSVGECIVCGQGRAVVLIAG